MTLLPLSMLEIHENRRWGSVWPWVIGLCVIAAICAMPWGGLEIAFNGIDSGSGEPFYGVLTVNKGD